MGVVVSKEVELGFGSRKTETLETLTHPASRMAGMTVLEELQNFSYRHSGTRPYYLLDITLIDSTSTHYVLSAESSSAKLKTRPNPPPPGSVAQLRPNHAT